MEHDKQIAIEKGPGSAAEQEEIAVFVDRLYELSPKVFVTPAIIAVNALIFIAMALSGAGIFSSNAMVVLQWGSNFSPLTLGGQWWRLFTSMFVHFGIVHLLVNMLALYQTGCIAERMFGSVRFLMLYIVAGVSGGIASLLWHPVVNSAGASGAIFGVYASVVAFTFFGQNKVPGVVKRTLGKSSGPFLAYNILFSLVFPRIDVAAHIGGFVGGLVAGSLLARPVDVQARAARGGGRLALAALTCAVLLGAMSYRLWQH